MFDETPANMPGGWVHGVRAGKHNFGIHKFISLRVRWTDEMLLRVPLTAIVHDPSLIMKGRDISPKASRDQLRSITPSAIRSIQYPPTFCKSLASRNTLPLDKLPSSATSYTYHAGDSGELSAK